MANINNTSSYSAYLIEVGKFKRFYKEMQIHDLQKELDEMGDDE